MKCILKLNLFCLFLILTGSVFSQDTIFFKDKQKAVVLVKEVSPKEIHYKKIELPDGPMYVTDKKDVEKITYKNGYSEIIESTPPLVIQPSNEYGTVISVNRDKITYHDTKRRSGYMIELIDRHPDASRKADLLKINRSIKGLKVGQDVTRTIAIVCGGITVGTGLFTALVYSLDTYAGETIAVVPIAFGAAALVMTAAAVTININLKKKRNDFVNLYNQ